MRRQRSERDHEASADWPAEILDATEQAPAALLKERDDTHKMAEANKAFRTLQMVIKPCQRVKEDYYGRDRYHLK